VAYVTRYGHQSVADVLDWSVETMDRYHDALSRLVRRENDSGKEDE